MARFRSSGFTLIELITVVAIVAILAAIAVPAYKDQVRKGRRSEAISTLQDAQLRLERWRVDHADFTAPSPAPASYPAPADSAHYDFTVTAAAATPNNYTLSAAPLGDQQADECGTLTITNTNGVIAKSPSGTRCW